MHKIETGSKPILAWLSEEELEEGALEQAQHVAQLPFVHQHVALMPDVHVGYGVPIGCVFGARNVIIPHAVGYDIGCGMRAAKTCLTAEQVESELDELEGLVKERVPMGVGCRHDEPSDFQMPDLPRGTVTRQEFANARHQLGTLGAGNHFIEIQRDEEDTVWIMVHSGSRHLGHAICEHYDEIAQDLNERWYSSIPAEWDLAFFPTATSYGQSYIEEMAYALSYARMNRYTMMVRVIDAFCELFGKVTDSMWPMEEAYDCHHNYASLENHMGQNVWVHRKGATLARKGAIGIIPGDMGSPSYIVRGKGNVPSFTSCSHGAGRTMGRGEAKRTLDIEEEQGRLDSQGIHFALTKQNMDEAPGAYKDINQVMEQQADLVSVVTKLTPMLPMKG